MRTTLNIADDVFEAAKSIAHARRVSVGEALSDLARRGMDAERRIGISPVTGFPVILARPGAPPITLEDIQRVQDEIDREDAERAFGYEFLKKP